MCLAKVGALTGEMLQLKLSIRRREPSIPRFPLTVVSDLKLHVGRRSRAARTQPKLAMIFFYLLVIRSGFAVFICAIKGDGSRADDSQNFPDQPLDKPVVLATNESSG